MNAKTDLKSIGSEEAFFGMSKHFETLIESFLGREQFSKRKFTVLIRLATSMAFAN